MPTWYAIWCPRGDECTKRGRMLCKFDDEEKTRSFLFNHLVSSPYHQLGDEEATQLARETAIEAWDELEDSVDPGQGLADQEVKEEEGAEQEVVDDEYPDEQEYPPSDEPPDKKFKGSGKPKGCKGKDSKGKGKKAKGKGKNKGITRDEISSAVAAGMEQGLARLMERQGASSSSQPSSAIVQADLGLSDTVTISKSALGRICDCLQRAEDTCTSSARVAQAAVTVFEREAKNLQTARQVLQSIAHS